MGRLIDADALIEDLHASIFYADAIPNVEEAPTVDAVPVVHGKWKPEFDDEFGCLLNRCSNCGYMKRTDFHIHIGWNFCPNCGAKMDLERSEDGKID